MKQFQFLFALIWAVTTAWATPTPIPGSSSTTTTPTTQEDSSYAAWKTHHAGMQAGKIYIFKALTPLTEAAKIAGDQALQDTRNAIGGDHAYFIAVEITSSTSKATKKKAAVTTLKADARYFDLYTKTGSEDVHFHEYIAWSTTYAADKDITYTYKKEYTASAKNKNGASLKTASKAYAAVSTNKQYKAGSNDCGSYVDYLIAHAS